MNSDNADYKLTELTKEDVDETLECMLRTFPSPSGEVMARSLEITPDDYRSYGELVCQKAVKDGLSLLLRDAVGERICGFLIAEDFTSLPDYRLKKVSQKFLPLLCLLEELDDQYCDLRNPKPNEVLHLYMLGVDPSCSKKGLGRWLVQAALELGTQAAYSSAIAEATGVASQRICQSMGFEKVCGIGYRNFDFQGNHIFRGIESPSECILVEKILLDRNSALPLGARLDSSDLS
jgi:ribosomal protein S18 acetylase RimI-like enzyme